MAQPGWYPDPEGGPTPRWCDGRSWAPRRPGSGQPPKGRGGLIVGLAIGVVFVGLLAGLLILRPWDGTAPVGTDTRTARPTGTQWDERKTSVPDKPYEKSDEIGKAGVERSYEEFLRGRPGRRRAFARRGGGARPHVRGGPAVVHSHQPVRHRAGLLSP